MNCHIRPETFIHYDPSAESKELGADAGHSKRENAESDLAKQLDKHLGDN